MKLLVTGSASHLAKPLLPKLCHEDEIKQIIGVDIKPSRFQHTKYQHQQLDIRDDQLNELMTDVDAVIHMAFVVMPGTLKKQRLNRQLIHDINVNGSNHLFQLVHQHQIKSLIYLSSAAVYGAWPDNPLLINEQQALRAMPGFSYSEDKVEVEKLLDQLETQKGAPRIVRLRPHVILGPHAQPLLLRLLQQPFYPRLPNPQPLTQCVWEEDVCDAVVLALRGDCRGAFNLAADPAMSFKEMVQFNHKINVALPFGLLKKLHRLVWKFSGIAGDPAWMEGMAHHLAVDSSKARQQLGWQPKKNTHDCLRAIRHLG